MIVVRSFPSEGIVAGFDETPGGGSRRDINAPRNAPALHPEDYLDRVYFHSSFDHYTIAAMDLAKVINHASVAGVSGNQYQPPGPGDLFLSNAVVTVNGQIVVTTRNLLTHDMGLVPKFVVAYNDMMIPHGTPIQRDAPGLVRFVSAYATSTEIRLREIGYSTASDLSAATRTYSIFVFADPAADPALPLMSGDADFVQLGRGKIDSRNRTMRVTATGETPYGIQLGPAAFLKNGGVRVFTPDGTAINVASYDGSASAPAAIGVGF